MGFSFKKIGKKVTDNYYILVLSINFAFMFNFDIHLGVLVTTISLLYGIKLSSIKSSSPLIKNIVILFILFNLLSGILYVSNRLPISVYFDEIKMQMLQIFFFFIGNNSKETYNYF